MDFKKMLINYSGIILFVHVDKEVIHKYMQYGVSMIVFLARITNQDDAQHHGQTMIVRLFG